MNQIQLDKVPVISNDFLRFNPQKATFKPKAVVKTITYKFNLNGELKEVEHLNPKLIKMKDFLLL